MASYSGKVIVVVLESTYARQYLVPVVDGTVRSNPISLPAWDPAPYFGDPNGIRLVEEVVRRLRKALASADQLSSPVAITLPGTILGVSVIDGSSRLGITGQVDVLELSRRLGGPECRVFHDAEALAVGEVRHGRSKGRVMNSRDFAYILIDEGIGSAIFIDGKVHKGAGVAGHLGRLVVNPGGAYNRAFASRGPLEVYAARPWVSRNIVGEYLAEVGKRGSPPFTDGGFRAAVAADGEGDWSALTLQQIAAGLATRDPIVQTVLEDAAQYLSVAINAVITIVNPPLLILAGGMIDALPTFADTVVSQCRRHAWAGSWNETEIHVATLGRQAQVLGAAEMLMDAIG